MLPLAVCGRRCGCVLVRVRVRVRMLVRVSGEAGPLCAAHALNTLIMMPPLRSSKAELMSGDSGIVLRSL